MKLTSLLAVAAALGAATAPGGAQWSQPATLGPCPSSAQPRVVFPSDTPSHATGPGAIVWAATSACPGGEGARVTTIGAGEAPGATSIPRTAAGRPIAPRGTLAVSSAPHGQIAIAGASPGSRARGLLIQGRAGGPFSQLWSIAGPPAPLALASAYLGDVGLAYQPTAGRGVSASEPGVRVERYYSNVLTARTSPNAGMSAAQAMSAVTLALDYRTDALSVWAQDGALYAHDLPASGARHPVQRLAHIGARPRIAALLSDDNRAIVAWAEDRTGQTSVYLDRSAVGVRFGAPTLLERFRDPDGIPSPTGSPSLVRLSSESVIMAWAGSAEGHWVVRTAAVDLNGLGSATTLATPGQDALLDALAPGPNDDALALWSEPQQAGEGSPPDMSRQAIFSARGTVAGPNRTQFGTPEQVAPPGPNSDATIALDPNGGGALAVWRGEGAELRYAIRAAAAGAG